jgi:hypothetical protein
MHFYYISSKYHCLQQFGAIGKVNKRQHSRRKAMKAKKILKKKAESNKE